MGFSVAPATLGLRGTAFTVSTSCSLTVVELEVARILTAPRAALPPTEIHREALPTRARRRRLTTCVPWDAGPPRPEKPDKPDKADKQDKPERSLAAEQPTAQAGRSSRKNSSQLDSGGSSSDISIAIAEVGRGSPERYASLWT